MLHHPTLDKLAQLRLHGMHQALREQLALPAIDDLGFEAPGVRIVVASSSCPR